LEELNLPTTAIATVLVAAIAATVAVIAWQKPAPGSKADNAAGAVLALVGFPLGTALILQHAWAEIAAVRIAAWVLTVGFTRGRARESSGRLRRGPESPCWCA